MTDCRETYSDEVQAWIDAEANDKTRFPELLNVRDDFYTKEFTASLATDYHILDLKSGPVTLLFRP